MYDVATDGVAVTESLTILYRKRVDLSKAGGVGQTGLLR
jgi:hypothetical protein